MYQLVLVMSTYWTDNQTGVSLGGVTSQVISHDDTNVLKEKATIIVAQFEKQGITVAWTIA